MKLFERIVAADAAPFADLHSEAPAALETETPVAVLTCIDARLNHLMPRLLRVPEDRLVWLRNAGNIVTEAQSEALRSLALACAVEGTLEIAVIGHTDCLICKSTVLDLIRKFERLGIGRTGMPDNLTEFFGLFASEHQNVLAAVGRIRQSPLIPAAVPVHGLLLDLNSSRLSWVVDGYHVLDQATTGRPLEASPSLSHLGGEHQIIGGREDVLQLQGEHAKISSSESDIGRIPDPPDSSTSKIGEHAILSPIESRPIPGHQETSPATLPSMSVGEKPGDLIAAWMSQVDLRRRFRVLGTDNRVYGPVSSEKLFGWIDEGRVEPSTMIQMEEGGDWKSLKDLANQATRVLMPSIPLPPRLNPRKGSRLDTEGS